MASVLLLDHDLRFARLVGMILRDRCHVQVTTSEDEALRCLREACPDLFMVDLETTGNEGLSLLKETRTLPHRPAVLVLTERFGGTIEERSYADARLSRPVDPLDLTRTVEWLTASTSST